MARCAGIDIAISVTTAIQKNAAAKDTKSIGGTRNKSIETRRPSLATSRRKIRRLAESSANTARECTTEALSLVWIGA